MNRRQKNTPAIRVLLVLVAVMFVTLALRGLCTGRVTTRFGPEFSFRTEPTWFFGHIAMYACFAGAAFYSAWKR